MHRYLPNTPEEAAAIPIASMPVAAVIEAVATGGANKAAKLAMAGMIARVGRKYTDAARAYAAEIANGSRPIPTVADIPEVA